MNENERFWECPHCGSVNIDNEKETIFPMCGNCAESFEWLDILPDNKIFVIEVMK